MLCVAFTYAGIRDSLDESDCSRTGDVEYLNNNAKQGDGLGGEGQSRRKVVGHSREREVGISRWRGWTSKGGNEKDRG